MLENKNGCHTYFLITGDFDPDFVTKLLGLKPYLIKRKTDESRSGGQLGHAEWRYGYNDVYEPIAALMMKKTIKDLVPKAPLIRAIKHRFDVRIFLEVVPEVYYESVLPALAPSLEVMDFCVKSGTELDIDLYVL